MKHFMRYHSSKNNHWANVSISDTDFEQTLKAYENHKMWPCIYKAVVYIWTFLSLRTNSLFFFPKFLATH